MGSMWLFKFNRASSGRVAGFVAAAAIAVALCQQTAAADDKAPEDQISGSVTVYGWLPSMRSSFSTGQAGGSVTVGSTDLLDALLFAAMGSGEIRYGRFGFVGDLVYSNIASDGAANTPFPASGHLKQKMALLTGVATYRAYQSDQFLFDLAAGARWVAGEGTVTVTGSGPGGISTTTSSSDSWLDPVVGFRAAAPIASGFSAVGFADIGGFGVGSDFSWEVYGGLDYEFSDRFVGRLGFRYISIDYSKSGVKYDTELFGPAAGLTIRF